jgi:transcriptional regulator with XRE-family HTH domain
MTILVVRELKVDNNYMNLGVYLKKLREDSELSQDSVAHQISISRPTYLQIEKGERDLTIPEAEKLAGLFNLTLTDFLSKKFPAEVLMEAGNGVKKQHKVEERISIPQERAEKFKEVLLYILKNVGAKPNVGEAVLCKLLYFMDFDFYEKFEEQLIGAKYIKNHFGPTPVEFLNVVKNMEKDGDLVKVVSKFFDYNQRKYLPRREPDLSILTVEELQVIDSVLARLSDKTAAEMRDYSHEDVPWLTAEDGKTIDYESVFYRTAAYSVRSYGDEL